MHETGIALILSVVVNISANIYDKNFLMNAIDFQTMI